MPAPPPFPVIEQPKPKLTWHQYVWIGWPTIPIAAGGAIGGACGGAAMAINYKVFQKTNNPVLRYVWTGLISLAAVVTYVVCATIIYMLIHRNH
ncbi:MAG TPA: hypothetical protein VMO20_02740 [Candidatus Acidoferrum sp.]|nr:hypothetical protein [Candidatus Acidoferrum sp.]